MICESQYHLLRHILEVRLCEHALTPASALMGTPAISLQTAEVAAAQRALCLKYFAARLGVKRAAELKGVSSLSDIDVLCWDSCLQRDDGWHLQYVRQVMCYICSFQQKFICIRIHMFAMP